MEIKCASCPFKWTDSKSVDVCDIFYKLRKYNLCSLCHNTADPNWQYELCPLKDLKEAEKCPSGITEELLEDIAEVLFPLLYPKAQYTLWQATDNEYWNTIFTVGYIAQKVLEMKE